MNTTAERGLLSGRLARSSNTTAQLVGSVQVYRALGGGWQVFEPAATLAVATHFAPLAAPEASAH
jgi:outer membrane protein, multidrug efflux system